MVKASSDTAQLCSLGKNVWEEAESENVVLPLPPSLGLCFENQAKAEL